MTTTDFPTWLADQVEAPNSLCAQTPERSRGRSPTARRVAPTSIRKRSSAPCLQSIAHDLENPSVPLPLRVESHEDTPRVVRAVWYNDALRGGISKRSPAHRLGDHASALLDPESTGAAAIYVFAGGAVGCHNRMPSLGLPFGSRGGPVSKWASAPWTPDAGSFGRLQTEEVWPLAKAATTRYNEEEQDPRSGTSVARRRKCRFVNAFWRRSMCRRRARRSLKPPLRWPPHSTPNCTSCMWSSPSSLSYGTVMQADLHSHEMGRMWDHASAHVAELGDRLEGAVGAPARRHRPCDKRDSPHGRGARNGLDRRRQPRPPRTRTASRIHCQRRAARRQLPRARGSGNGGHGPKHAEGRRAEPTATLWSARGFGGGGKPSSRWPRTTRPPSAAASRAAGVSWWMKRYPQEAACGNIALPARRGTDGR